MRRRPQTAATAKRGVLPGFDQGSTVLAEVQPFWSKLDCCKEGAIWEAGLNATPSLVWFRLDLRLRDNPALLAVRCWITRRRAARRSHHWRGCIDYARAQADSYADRPHAVASWWSRRVAHEKGMARLEGFEPPTSSFEGWRSIQLSYRRTVTYSTTMNAPLRASSLGGYLGHDGKDVTLVCVTMRQHDPDNL